MDGSPSAFAAYFLVGCTASGKTAVAHEIARRTGALVLSADSMLVYRGMDVGTAKPTAAERAGVELRGVELSDPDEPFSTGRWLESARDALAEAAAAGRDVVVAGGTGLYVSALLHGLDTREADPARRAELEALLARGGVSALLKRAEALKPGATTRVDTRNPRRVLRLVEILESHAESAEFESHAESAEWKSHAEFAESAEGVPPLVGLDFPVETLNERIERRARAMFEGGLLDEVRALTARFPGFEKSTAGAGIGYAEALAALCGELSVGDAVARTAARTRRLAKKQRTWWRHQARVEWVRGPADAVDAARAADDVLALWRKHGKTPVRA
ncbi:MAG: tRNA (adenosine(37)-N6)-dimethylallyltransferase MiaA [Kiritimatiellae bacterium]|nr:tRNA (adenosine(37)-N6)-dimethylallyltransferase MiaA [Kiritimatiellia bacterium]